MFKFIAAVIAAVLTFTAAAGILVDVIWGEPLEGAAVIGVPAVAVILLGFTALLIVAAREAHFTARYTAPAGKHRA